MRAPGDVNAALLQACHVLMRADQAPTMREMARRARVGRQAAKVALANMCRAGVLRIVRRRAVDYCSRPVAEYMPTDLSEHERSGPQVLAMALATWRR